MIPLHIDLRKMAAVSVVLGVILYTAIALLFKIPAHLMFLKLGLIVALVGGFWLYFDKWGWRQRVFRLGGWLCDIPDLNGRWEGTVDRVGENDPHLFVQEIRQTFSRIQLYAYSKNSRGQSIVSHFVCDHLKGRYSLVSTWQCRTKNRTDPNGTDEFYGTSIYEIAERDDGRYLEDFYFTRREPQTKGKTILKFAGRKLKNGV